jgi:hypothetical protein
MIINYACDVTHIGKHCWLFWWRFLESQIMVCFYTLLLLLLLFFEKISHQASLFQISVYHINTHRRVKWEMKKKKVQCILMRYKHNFN